MHHYDASPIDLQMYSKFCILMFLAAYPLKWLSEEQ